MESLTSIAALADTLSTGVEVNNISSTMDEWAGPSSAEYMIGSTYIIEALIFIPLHVLVCYLIYSDKEFKNPTYFIMINVGIADIIELSMTGIYSGMIVLTRWQNETMARMAGLLCIGSWYSNAALFVLIALSRWVTITRPHLVKIVFRYAPRNWCKLMCHVQPWNQVSDACHFFRKRNLYAMQAFGWLIMGIPVFYGHIIYAPGPTFIFLPDYYTWTYDTSLPLGRAFQIIDTVFDAGCTTIEMTLNVLALYHVHKTRKQIRTVATSANRRREIKLLLQCFVLGCIFTATYIIFATVFAFPELASNVSMCLVIQYVWLINHSVNPLVYLAVNKRLRTRAIRLVTFGKFGNEEKPNVKVMVVKSESS